MQNRLRVAHEQDQNKISKKEAWKGWSCQEEGYAIKGEVLLWRQFGQDSKQQRQQK
jgi:hypothetical protein